MSNFQPQNNHSNPPASPNRSKFWPFNRSRSSSPNTQGHAPNLALDTSFNATRSRKSSANSHADISPSGSNNSFVVRSVIRNPGGVSLPTSPSETHSPRSFFGNDQRQQSPSPGGVRRMTLEDSDDDMQTQQQLQYTRSKSKPLGTASLSVPAGGPGGGVGYGTARSSNDGKPESSVAAGQLSPYFRPSSPSGSMKAGDFNRGASKERGRSPRKSISSSAGSNNGHSDQQRSGSNHSAVSGHSNGVKKPIATITAGPKSLVQQQQDQQSHHQHHFHQQQRGVSPAAVARSIGLSGPRQYPGGASSPSGPHYHVPPGDPRNRSTDARGFPLFTPQQPSMQYESVDEPPARSRRLSSGVAGNRSRKNSELAQVPNMGVAAPLDGLPSPVDIPYVRSSQSPLCFDGDHETDHLRANFGSVPPTRASGSPNSSGFLSTLIRRQAAADQQERNHDDSVPRSCSPHGGAAGKWFKGVFGRSPRGDEKEPNYSADPYPPYHGGRDAEDQAAYAQKLASMRQARLIVDEERNHQMMAPVTPTRGFDPNQDREFRPKQVVDSDTADGLDAALEFELGRKESPPDRKPVPAYLSRMGGEPKEEFPLESMTPAQKIIAETRSKQLAREQIEAQRKGVVASQQTIANANPKQKVAANAQINGSPTPPKNKAESQLHAHHQRFPSGAHQITREPAKGVLAATTPTNPTPQTANAPPQRRGNTLAPGTGPLPLDLPLPLALQEMMIRFYRFERYSVPLIRSLETRLLDIERDAMLSANPCARTASVSSSHSAEMDRWVQQMTSVMKHEVGQLKAATDEIRESRELVSVLARGVGNGVGNSMSVSSFGSIAAITPSATVQPVPTFAVQQKQNGEQTQAEVHSGIKLRDTNVSSSTFESAIPRDTNLALPANAKPALSKDEGKFSPTKSNFGFASESAKEQTQRDRSVSPNSRPRFTSVLGQPLQTQETQSSSSPAPSEGMKRDVSVEDRLKALVDGKESVRSRSPSFTSAAASLPVSVEKERMEEEEDEQVGDESVSNDIAAALAAIDAASAISHEEKISEGTLRELHHVSVIKNASNSSSTSSKSVAEPLTPFAIETHAKDVSEISAKLGYLGDEPKSTLSSPVKKHFGGTNSPTAAQSGRISPNKLFAHKFASNGGSTGSSTSSSSANNSFTASAKLGLVERKRFTLPAPSAAADTGARAGDLSKNTVIQVRQQGGEISKTPNYSLDQAEKAAPTSTAFSGLPKLKPVGHRATLMERVAFFDAAK
ncbi:uncharacterized protein MEPE_06774 [Melanopsichium pennsylvanicum]|uniref:Uncharacterized protein n=2 Tax=Melanopsichium pennsylvanicum TaxID=63383 RepID=A0AAJ5C8U4_9BASI|nr:uncharacterized protein MEPE_06774 [Melanopsichium pennsylvanicum]